MSELITTEGPILLGFVAFAAVVAAFAFLTYLASSEVTDRRRRNRTRRAARRGDAGARRLLDLDAARTQEQNR